jgi:hypothetical protein
MMGSDVILARLRQFLLVITAGIFVMTAAELFFLAHWNETIQFLPFALCGLGLIAVTLVYFRPTRTGLKLLRGSMILIGVSSLVGFYKHMAGNYRFWLELYPNAGAWDLVKATLEGEFPVLAPGILLIGAVIGLAAAYQHPLLHAE